jgi:hypothetical protein
MNTKEKIGPYVVINFNWNYMVPLFKQIINASIRFSNGVSISLMFKVRILKK